MSSDVEHVRRMELELEILYRISQAMAQQHEVNLAQSP